jgi:hypothetical protein
MKRECLGMVALCCVLGALSTAAASPALAASHVDCGNWADHGDGRMRWGMIPIQGAGSYNLTTHAVGCATARSFVRRYRGTDTYYPTWVCPEVNEYESPDTRCTASGGRVIRWQSGS